MISGMPPDQDGYHPVPQTRTALRLAPPGRYQHQRPEQRSGHILDRLHDGQALFPEA